MLWVELAMLFDLNLARSRDEHQKPFDMELEEGGNERDIVKLFSCFLSCLYRFMN